MTKGMLNPWAQLPTSAPYVLPADAPHIQAFNEAYEEEAPHYFDLSLPPEPVLGVHRARLVLLSANPGRDPADLDCYRQRDAVQRALQDAASADGTPVRWLRDDMSQTPGGRWWRRVVKGLRQPTGYDYEDLSERVLLVEFYGYHSRRWSWLPVTLPSQWYSFDIVKQAINRSAVIVILRAARAWKIAVPQLTSYQQVAVTNSVQTSAVSPGNLRPEDFNMVCNAVARA